MMNRPALCNPPHVLILSDTSFAQSRNHRVQHVVAQMERWGIPFDLVGQRTFSTDGAPDRWTRLSSGLNAMARRRIDVAERGGNRTIIVRNLPGIFDYLAEDLWGYANAVPLLRKHYDLCIFGHPNTVLLALLLRRRKVVGDLIYDDWDYYPGHATTRGRFGRSMVRWREKLCIENAGLVCSVSHSLAELRREQGARRVIVAPNGADYSLFRTAQIKRPHPPTLIFMGSLYKAWGVDLTVRALPSIRTVIPDIRFMVLGEGPEMATLKALAYENLRLEGCVFFLGRQDYHNLPHFLAEADLGMLTYRAEQFVKYASSVKATEYMAAGLPVVSTRVAEVAEAIGESHAGKIVDFTPEAVSEAVVDLLRDSTLYRACSDGATEYAREHDWGETLRPLGEVICAYPGQARFHTAVTSGDDGMLRQMGADYEK